MVEKVMDLVTKYFEEQDIKVEQVADRDIVARWKIENGHIDILFQFDLGGEMVRIIGMNFLEVDEKYWSRFYEIINDLNDDNMFVKVVLDKSAKQIRLEYEHLINEGNCGDICFQLMVQMTRTAEKIIPTFMKIIWG